MNYNVAAAISLVIVVIVGISMLVVNKYDKDNFDDGEADYGKV